MVFIGNGYMLLGLEVDVVLDWYWDDFVVCGGFMMLFVVLILFGCGLSLVCVMYGFLVLIFFDVLLDVVYISVLLCM